ncbi:MAG TPA: sugar transferase [Bryobacteraceae bacterium]|nr:sugar transferase [Bryobacteraceae bacterium]
METAETAIQARRVKGGNIDRQPITFPAPHDRLVVSKPMFRSQQRKTRILFGLSDAALTFLAFEIAYELRHNLPFAHDFFLRPDTKALLLVYSVITWVAAGYWLNVSGHIDSARISTILRETLRQVGYSALGLTIFLVFGHALEIPLARGFLVFFFVISWFLLASFHIAARNLIPLLGSGTQRHILIVGLGERAQRLAAVLETYYEQGVRIAGFLAPPGDFNGRDSLSPGGRPYPVFPTEELRPMLSRRVIDEIHFAVDSDKLLSLEEVFLWCDEEGVCNRIALDFFPHVNSSIALERLGSTPLLTFSAAPDDEVLLLAKRVIDVALAVALGICLSPVILLAAVLIKTTSRGSLIFRQTRCGLNGRTFTLYKFRSMVLDAEDRLSEVAHLNSKEIVTKIPNDPRLTAVGKWLRRFSIDELPQLFNVLRGDMSIVGPRPAIPSEVAKYQRWQRRRLRMRPGLTSLWAVEGRDQVDFEKWMRLDMQYIDNWSLSLDARIILRTIPQVLSGRAS